MAGGRAHSERSTSGKEVDEHRTKMRKRSVSRHEEETSSYGFKSTFVQHQFLYRDEFDVELSSEAYEHKRFFRNKLNELVEKRRQLDEEIAQCETNIYNLQKGNVYSIPKINRLAEAILRPKSSCEQLDDICNENRWISPSYNIGPSTGDGKLYQQEEGFQARVSIQGIDFSTTVHGNIKSSAQEARISAAANMLHRLCILADQVGLHS